MVKQPPFHLIFACFLLILAEKANCQSGKPANQTDAAIASSQTKSDYYRLSKSPAATPPRDTTSIDALLSTKISKLDLPSKLALLQFLNSILKDAPQPEARTSYAPEASRTNAAPEPPRSNATPEPPRPSAATEGFRSGNAKPIERPEATAAIPKTAPAEKPEPAQKPKPKTFSSGKLSFSVRYDDTDTAEFEWQENGSDQTDYFIFYRKVGSGAWLPIGGLKGVQRDAETEKYYFRDLNPPSGKVLYKLKRVGADRKTEMSEEVALER